MSHSETLDKSKGFAFTYEGVDFYHGVHSEGSYCGLVDDTLVYLSSPACRMFGRERVAKFKIEGQRKKE